MNVDPISIFFLFIVQVSYSSMLCCRQLKMPTNMSKNILTSNCWFLELEEFIANESDDETWFSNSCVSKKNKFEMVDPARRHVSWPVWFLNRNCVDVVVLCFRWRSDVKRWEFLVSLTTFFRSWLPFSASTVGTGYRYQVAVDCGSYVSVQNLIVQGGDNIMFVLYWFEFCEIINIYGDVGNLVTQNIFCPKYTSKVECSPSISRFREWHDNITICYYQQSSFLMKLTQSLTWPSEKQSHNCHPFSVQDPSKNDTTTRFPYEHW
jgi:hypothetical protein